MTRRPVLSLACRAAIVAALSVLGAAASAVGAHSGAAATNLSLTATGRDACTPTSLTAQAGEITLSYTNPTDRSQNFGIVGVGTGSPQDVRHGATSTLTATLSAGAYTFWCGDEESKGMRGTLTVTAPTTTPPPPPPPTTNPPPTPPPPPSGLSISTSDDSFSTTSLTADAGNITVTVTNVGRDDHTFTIGGLVNIAVAPGQTKTQTFYAAAGTYTYVCAYHGSMRGTLTVRQTATAPPPPPPPSSPPPSPPPPPPPPSGGGSASVTITDFAFSPGTINVPAGPVSLTVANAGVVPHTFTVDGLVNVSVAPGQSTTVTFTATEGTYRIYCGVSGHVSLGMTGSLVVGSGGGGTAPPPTAPKPPPGAPAPPAPPGTTAVTITDFAFSPGSISVPAGTVNLAITNSGALPHTFTIDGLVNVELAAGQTTTVSFSAAPGTYGIYCGVAGHVSLGMAATLVVTSGGGGGGGAAAPPATPKPPAGGGGASAGDGAQPGHNHAGHQTSGATQSLSLARSCRPKGSIVLRGTVTAVSARQLSLAVATTNRAGRAFRKKRAALLLHSKTIFGRVGAPALQGLSKGDKVTAYAGRCRAYGKRLVGMRVDVTRLASPASGDNAPAAGGTTLQLTADAKGFPRFDKSSLEAPAGKVTLVLTNPSPLPHNIAIEGHGAGKQVSGGGKSTVTAVLKPGSYTFMCTVPGHAQAGMKGTLTIR